MFIWVLGLFFFLTEQAIPWSLIQKFPLQQTRHSEVKVATRLMVKFTGFIIRSQGSTAATPQPVSVGLLKYLGKVSLKYFKQILAELQGDTDKPVHIVGNLI